MSPHPSSTHPHAPPPLQVWWGRRDPSHNMDFVGCSREAIDASLKKTEEMARNIFIGEIERKIALPLPLPLCLCFVYFLLLLASVSQGRILTACPALSYPLLLFSVLSCPVLFCSVVVCCPLLCSLLCSVPHTHSPMPPRRAPTHGESGQTGRPARLPAGHIRRVRARGGLAGTASGEGLRTHEGRLWCGVVWCGVV
jgi:hypothetical protein